MATLKKYSLDGKEQGTVDVVDDFVDYEVCAQLVKDYIVAIRKNARQWSACTQGRSEVSHSKKKPHPQKGTGRARQGSLAAPQYKGGGVVFGPKPKFDQHVRINRKERRAAMRHLLAEMIRDSRVVVLENPQMSTPSTKTLVGFLKSVGLSRRVLFLEKGESAQIEKSDGSQQEVSVATRGHEHLAKSLRNIPKVHFSLAMNLNGYDLAIADHLVVTEDALGQLLSWLGGVGQKAAVAKG